MATTNNSTLSYRLATIYSTYLHVQKTMFSPTKFKQDLQFLTGPSTVKFQDENIFDDHCEIDRHLLERPKKSKHGQRRFFFGQRGKISENCLEEGVGTGSFCFSAFHLCLLLFLHFLEEYGSYGKKKREGIFHVSRKRLFENPFSCPPLCKRRRGQFSIFIAVPSPTPETKKNLPPPSLRPLSRAMNSK